MSHALLQSGCGKRILLVRYAKVDVLPFILRTVLLMLLRHLAHFFHDGTNASYSFSPATVNFSTGRFFATGHLNN